MLTGLNFLWYVAAFLAGRELLRLMIPERAAIPATRPVDAGEPTSPKP